MRVKWTSPIWKLTFILLSLWLSWTLNGWEREVIMPTYTVKQGENGVSLAEKLKVPLLSLLNRNPDIKALRPGVGLNVPRIPPTGNIGLLGRRDGGSFGGGGAPGQLHPTEGQGPPHPPGGKGGGGGGPGPGPIPPRFTPPPGTPYRPPPGG